MHPSEWQLLHAQATHDPEAYWENAAEGLTWQKRWRRVSDCDFNARPVRIRWFEGATLNVAENCLDRHLATRADHTALLWVPDEPDAPARHITYREFHAEVCRAANMLESLGIKAGERVIIYMPMIPEAAVAMLACARIGAVHSVVFGGFSAHALAERIRDCDASLIITAEEGRRGGKKIALRSQVTAALESLQSEVPVLCVGGNTTLDWQAQMALQLEAHTAQAFDAEHPLFILYTSGSTGTPKGLVHSSGGYLLQAMHSFTHVFDVQDGDVFWCTADIGWITGHSYLMYGPLAAGTTTVMFEGVPNYPTSARCFEIIDTHHVTQFYTAPTALRMLMHSGDECLSSTTRTSLRVLGSVGEPINPEVWQWYHDKVGKGRCAVVDTWWQTETGAHLITPIPGAFPPKPGSAQQPYFGITPVLLRVDGTQAAQGEEGALCITQSWPSQARTIWGDNARFAATYFDPYPGMYFSGDAARQDVDGDYWLLGRMDDVLNVSGHRLGTAEIESALVAHKAVNEAAVVGVPHAIKGEGVYAFVILNQEARGTESLAQELKQWVRTQIGAIAVPEHVMIVEGLPKTRSGKIMRRILRKIASGEVSNAEDITLLGDISTLLDPEGIRRLIQRVYPEER